MPSQDTRFNLSFCGVGLLWGFGFLFFFLSQTSSTQVPLYLQGDLYYLGTTLVFSVLIAVGSRKLGALKHHFWIAPASCVALVVGTLAISLIDLFSVRIAWVSCASNSILGAGIGCFWIIWGELLAHFDFDVIEETYLVCPVVAGILVLLIIAVRQTVGISRVTLEFLFALLPLFSYLLFRRVYALSNYNADGSGQPDSMRYQQNTDISKTALPRVIISLVCVFLIFSLVWKAFLIRNDQTFDTLIILFVGGVFVALVIMWVSLRHTRGVSLQTLYQWSLPTLVLGIILSLFTKSTFIFGAFICLITTNVGFEIMSKLLFTHIAHRNPSQSVKIISLGFMSASMSGLIVLLIWSPVEQCLEKYGFQTVVLAALFIFVCIISFSMNMDESMLTGDDQAAAEVVTPVEIEQNTLTERCNKLAEEYGLSRRETEVMTLIAQGRSRAYIRETLYISKGTVDSHAHHIYTKLGVKSKSELVALVLGD